MLRNQWQFKFEAGTLAKAARAKVEHHRGRLEFWQATHARVMEEIKDSGIEVSASSAGLEYVSNKGIAPQVYVNQDLQRKISEAFAKVHEHTAKVAEYEGWVEVLEGNSKEYLPLNSDDYLFFFGKK